jgi:hypothetical protein
MQKKKLTLLTAKSLGDKNETGTSSIPVITSATASPFFSLKAKAKRCLKYIDCNYMQFRNQDRTADSFNSLEIIHQNIRGLRSNTDELIFKDRYINPQVLCSSEHHMEEQEPLYLTLPGYIFRLNFCHQNLQNRGVCTFVHKDLYFSKINISNNCKEQHLEICAIELRD